MGNTWLSRTYLNESGIINCFVWRAYFKSISQEMKLQRVDWSKFQGIDWSFCSPRGYGSVDAYKSCATELNYHHRRPLKIFKCLNVKKSEELAKKRRWIYDELCWTYDLIKRLCIILVKSSKFFFYSIKITIIRTRRTFALYGCDFCCKYFFR